MTEQDIRLRVFGWDCDKLKWELNPFGYEQLNLDGGIEHDDSFVQEDIDELIIEQYACTNDKNGVEIYNNDILRQEVVGLGYYYYVVEWYRGCFFLKGINKKSRTAMFLYPEDDFKSEFEVIGNVHQNPELLEE